MKKAALIVLALMVGALLLLQRQVPASAPAPAPESIQEEENEVSSQTDLKRAILAGGCFWCTEAVFKELQGVQRVVSGYIGGQVEDPTYEAVSTGSTGHAEAVEIRFDPQIVTFEELLEVHFRTHNPTTLNRQGNDVGTQYRSGIFTVDDEQARIASEVIAALEAEGAYDDPIVTEVTAASTFYTAEEYHQDYFAKNPGAGYCQFVVAPKVEKFRKVFKDRLKP